MLLCICGLVLRNKRAGEEEWLDVQQSTLSLEITPVFSSLSVFEPDNATSTFVRAPKSPTPLRLSLVHVTFMVLVTFVAGNGIIPVR